MRYRDALLEIEGLRNITARLEILSGAGSKCLMEADFMTDKNEIEKKLSDISIIKEFIERKENQKISRDLQRILMGVRDITSTLNRIGEGKTPDDVELFEVKGLAMATMEIRILIKGHSLEKVESWNLPDPRNIVELLDPENTRNAHFHIYDAYSDRLRKKRLRLKQLQTYDNSDREEEEKLIAECMIIEEEVREEIGERLTPFVPSLKKSLLILGKLDIALAKAKMAIELKMCRPILTTDTIRYEALRYLPVEEKLKERGKSFQPVDIVLKKGVTLITGANMGGKTITLKSLALAQALVQFGFYLTAEKAEIVPVERIYSSVGDEQSVRDGLSSFGAEILKIDGILKGAMESGKKCLILIDEPARTTNPEEGKAIAEAIIEMLDRTDSISVVTSHYSHLSGNGQRLKVKGVKNDVPEGVLTGKKELDEFIDYSLVEAGDGEVDHEALRVSRLLGIGEEFACAIEGKLIISP